MIRHSVALGQVVKNLMPNMSGFLSLIFCRLHSLRSVGSLGNPGVERRIVYEDYFRQAIFYVWGRSFLVSARAIRLPG